MTLSQKGSKATGDMVVTGAPSIARARQLDASGNDVYLVYPTGSQAISSFRGRK